MADESSDVRLVSRIPKRQCALWPPASALWVAFGCLNVRKRAYRAFPQSIGTCLERETLRHLYVCRGDVLIQVAIFSVKTMFNISR